MSGPQLALYAVSIGNKSCGFEAGHSPPSRAEAKNERSYTSIHSYAFITRRQRYMLRFI